MGPDLQVRSATLPPGQRRRGPRTPVQRLDARLRAISPDAPGRYAVADLSTRFTGAALPPDRRARSAASPVAAVSGASAPVALVTGPLPGTGGEWVPVRDVLPAMLAGRGPHLVLSPAVTAARLIGSIGYAVVGRPAVALAVAGVSYDTGPDSLLVRLDADGLIDEIGVVNGELIRGRLADVAGWLADRALATLTPLIDELHERTRYGQRPMWNLVADTVLGPATAGVKRDGAEIFGQQAGFAAGNAVLDALVARGAPIARRGTLCDGAMVDDAPGLAVQRGSCCLFYRQPGEEKCSTCPLVR